MTLTLAGRQLAAAVGAVLLTLLGEAALWNYQHRALADARRDAEAARLELAHQTVASQESAGRLKEDLAELLATNAELRAAVDAARAASPGAKPVSVATLQTSALPVQDVPREPRETASSGGAAHAPAPGQSGTVMPPAPPAPACVLAAGDSASVVVNAVTLSTDQGNQIVTGTAEAWRDSPGPRARLFGGRFTSALSDVHELAVPAPPRWGAGLLGVCGAAGCSPGVALLFPPAALFGLRFEATAGATVGHQTQVLGMLGLRW